MNIVLQSWPTALVAQGWLIRLALALLLASVNGGETTGPEAAEKHPLARAAVFEWAGSRIQVQLLTGRIVENLLVLDWRPGNRPASVASLTVAHPDNGKPVVLEAPIVKQLRTVGATYQLVFDQEARLLVVPDSPMSEAATKKTAATSRPASRRSQVPDSEEQRQLHYEQTGVWLWPDLQRAEQKQILTKQKEYIERVGQAMNPTRMHLFERRFFLFYTNMSGEWILRHANQLDVMYKTLCGLFGIDEQANVWHGKAIIVAFAHRADFEKFEREFFPNSTSYATAVGLAHLRPDGEVVISCHTAEDPGDFANTLVHETVHGFLFRYKSREGVPSWLDEGAAEWIAAHVTDAADHIKKRQQGMLVRLAEDSWQVKGRFFQADHIDGAYYGLAYSLTDFLLRRDRANYKQLMESTKTGVYWEEALRSAYGWSPDKLITSYREDHGLPVPFKTRVGGGESSDLSHAVADLQAQLCLEPAWRQAAQIPVFVCYDCDRDEDLKERLCQQAAKPDSRFRVVGCSKRGVPAEKWESETRASIRGAEQVIVLCGRDSNEASGISRELAMVQEENKPYFLLAGSPEGPITTPKSAKANDKLYTWNWQLVKQLIAGAR